jgi:hypothetical protein
MLAMGGQLQQLGNVTATSNVVLFGLTGVTQGTSGVLSGANVDIDSPQNIGLNQISATGNVDVQAGSAGGITQTANGVVSAGGALTFQAGQTINLSRVNAGGNMTLTSTGGSILDNNDTVSPNNLNVQASGNLSMTAFGDIGHFTNPIEIQVGGQVSVLINGPAGTHHISLSGSTGDGQVHVIFAPPGTLFRFNNLVLLIGIQGPDRAMNWFRDREKREYDFWSQDMIGDSDTAERELLNRRRPSRRPARTPVR